MRLPFELDPQIIHYIIYSQAGSIGKAVIELQLNGRQISRDPRSEKWDAEDDVAYYRVKEEGAVSIYNQSVLVRHDPAHQWGAGGLIVSKQAIGLNISRTEILPKTEARRERSAKSLLAGDQKLVEIFRQEETVTECRAEQERDIC